MNEPLGIIGQPDDQRFLRAQQLGRQRHARDERHVRRLDAAVGEVETGRRLRCARHADQADIGIIDAPARLPVIVIDREGHRIDAREIFAVEEMLAARHAMALRPEIGGERADDRVEHRDRLYLQLTATFLQQLTQRVVDQRKQHEPAIGLDAGDDALDLAACPYHAPDMLDGLRAIELHETGARHRMHRVAGRVRNEMEVKAAQHVAHSELWIAVPVVSGVGGQSARAVICPRAAIITPRFFNRGHLSIPGCCRSGKILRAT
jgi:hypothetical protein